MPVNKARATYFGQSRPLNGKGHVFIAPYLIERTKENINKQEHITNNQFEIIEKLVSLSSRYAVNARFLLQDLKANDLQLDVLQNRLDKYDEITEKTFNEYQIQAYRARMYFGAPELYEEVMQLYNRVAQIDSDILRLEKFLYDEEQKKQKFQDSERQFSEISHISDQIYNFNLESEKLLEDLFSRASSNANVTEKPSYIGAGKELPTR